MFLHFHFSQQFVGHYGRIFRKILCVPIFISLFAVLPARGLERDSIVVLVPGFLNSLSPTIHDGYFSQAVIDQFSIPDNGLITVQRELYSLGEIETNGKILAQVLKNQIQERHLGGRPITIVSHSAGSLYALFAATHSDLPIKKIISIGTPWRGAAIVDKTPLQVLSQILDRVGIDFLQQFKKDRIDLLLNQWPEKKDLAIYCLAGSQPLDWTQVHRAEYLAWPLSVPQSFIKEESDGVITVESAIPLSDPHRPSWIHKWGFVDTSRLPRIPLDHWEQVLEPQAFALFGVTNIDYIKKEQMKSFEFIKHHLL